MTKENKFEQWIFYSFKVSPEGLALSRIFSALFILFFLIPGMGMSHFTYLSSLPSDFYTPPPGPMMLLDEFPPLFMFQAVHTVIIVSLIAMLFGYYTKLSSIIAGVSILILQGFIFSIGKVNHELLIALVPIVMAFSNWGTRFSIDSTRGLNNREINSWPLTLLALFIGFMMFTAGFPKILGGWLDPSTQAVQGHLFNQFYVRERDAFLAPFFVGLNSLVFWEMLDWATIIFEVGFLAAVFREKLFKYFVCAAVFFHFSTMIMLNIAFLPNFLAYALFLPWNSIYNRIRRMYTNLSGITGHKSHFRPVLYFSITLLIIFSVIRWLSSMNIVLQDSDVTLHETLFLFAAVLTVMYLLFQKIVMKVSSTSSDEPSID